MSGDLQEVLDTLDLEWVLDREGVSYKQTYGRSGRQLNVRECPLCGSRSYKVYLNAETGLGNCFSGDCEENFNKWKFLRALFGLEPRETIQLLKQLAREQGWRPKRESHVQHVDLDQLELPDSVAIDSPATLPEYLARRGIDTELAKYFGLRWCESGTFQANDPTGRRVIQDYSQRVILPVLDLDLQLVTFQGRDATGEAEKRYLFPPGFAGSGAFLYNGYNWSHDMNTAIVCEGVFDVIGTKKALDTDPAFRDVLPIGTFGMHLSDNNPEGDDQLGRFLKLRDQGLKQVIFLWDGEYKAAKTAIKASQRLRGSLGLDCAIAFLPAGQDPGEARPADILQAIRGARSCSHRLEAARLLMYAKQLYGDS